MDIKKSAFFRYVPRNIWIAICTLFSLPGCYHLPSRESYKPPIQDDASMSRELESIREKYREPAMAAALIRGDRIFAKAAAGTLVAGGSEPVRLEHHFHIGSTTKPFTSLLMATLVRDGLLKYETTLKEALPATPMREDYKKVTIRDLLLNRAGVIPYQQKSLEDSEIIHNLENVIPARSNDPMVQRKLITEYALSREPTFAPGTKSVYSNVGWSILGYVAEKVAKKPFETLIHDRIFVPLGMKGARIGGWPASVSDPHQPRGHYVDKDGLRAQPLNDTYVFPSWMNPAGGIHCTIGDFALFAREILQGLQGKGKLLPQSAYAEIHTIHVKENINVMYQGAKQSDILTLGYGWAVIPIGDDLLSAGDGSGGTFYARVVVLPVLDLAYVGFTNSGAGEAALSESIRRFTGLPWGE